MRDQIEILEKIDGIAKMLFKHNPKSDPFFQQYKILVHKLSWENAIQFLTPADQTPANRIEWEKLNKLDKETLIREIHEQIDLGAMHVTGNDVEMAFHCATVLLAQFWLLGPIKDTILKALWKDYLLELNIYRCSEPVFEAVCNELQFDWKRLKLRYQSGMFSRLTDTKGRNIKLDLEQAVDESIKELKEQKS